MNFNELRIRADKDQRSVNVAFLVYREGLGPIFSSVYVNPAECLGGLGAQSQIVLLSSAGEFLKPALRKRWSSDSLVLSVWASKYVKHDEPIVLLCGGSQAAGLALDLKRRYPQIHVVYHSWGPEAAELEFAGAGGSEREVTPAGQHVADKMEASQARAMAAADSVIVISYPMMRWAAERYSVEKERMLHVPCFVDVEHFVESAKGRERVRSELGVSDEFVVAYCGSILPWQLSQQSLETLSIIREQKPNVHFVGLTMHQNPLRQMLDELGFPKDQTRIMTVPHWQVPEYLSAADMGILGRGLMQGPDIVNELSSPIKFGEYLACGTPVLMSVVVVLPHYANRDVAVQQIDQFLNIYAANQDATRLHCQEIALRELSLKKHCARLLDHYRLTAEIAENS